MPGYTKALLAFVALLLLWIALDLWVETPIAEAAPQATPTPTPTPRAVPGAAPDFQSESTKMVGATLSMRDPLFVKTLFQWIRRLQPNQGGIVWLAIVVTVLVAFDFSDLKSRRNLDILLLIAPSFFLIDLIPLGNTPEGPAQTALFKLLFLGLFLASGVLLIRALIGAFSRKNGYWTPNLPTSILVVLTVVLLASNTFLALVRHPDDAGGFTNYGAYRMLKTGKFPYGDPTLRGGAAATYGPILYLAHMPFQLGVSQVMAIVAPDPSSVFYRIVMGSYAPPGTRPPNLATQLALLAFHYLGVAGLVVAGRRLAGARVGWGLACLYAGSAYVHGLGGENWFITGMTYISHIAPAAVTILAFAALGRPLLAGALLATAVGVLFYPAFLFPLWLGYYIWRGKGWGKFAAGFLVVCLVIGASVLLLTERSENESAFQVIYESTIGHQEAGDAYGASTFSFWGTHPRWAAFWQKPLIEGWYLLKPSFLVFAIFIAASFFMARDRTVTQLALLTAAVAIAVQLWKSHAGGTYVEWYYPFFLVGLFAQQRPDKGEIIDADSMNSDSGEDTL